MRHTPRNLLRHELIGLEAEVVDSRNRSQVGIRGLILDETRNMLLIGMPGGRKRWVAKKDVVLRVVLPDGLRLIVEGRVLVGRPEERLKRRLRDW